MKFKLDENLPVDAANLLRQAGYDAMTVLDQAMGGNPDPSIAAVCASEKRALLTLDTDFADIRTYTPSAYEGIVVLRLKRQDKLHVLGVLQRMLPLLKSEPLRGCLWIVDEERIRIRS